jgi:Uma2 family endonuclease
MPMSSSVAESRVLTVADWAELDEDEPGELVDGRLEEEEMPSALHELVSSHLLRVLGAWAAARGGIAFGPELKLIVRGDRGRKADGSVYFTGRRLPGRTAGATRRPPSLVIEVLSPRPRDVRRDTIEKLREYAAFGVEYYWLVDPVARTLEVRKLGTAAVPAIALAAAEGAHEVPGCDGLVLDLDAMWAEADRLPESDEE